MASGRNRNNPPPPAAPGSARQNEYFVPRDGIDREVITADVCRYLGNDALVRPGTYEHPDGRVTQGYFITAYRNLTSAMIQDLKADSSRWDQERRAASRPSGNAAGGTMISSHPNAVYARNSNSPLAQSRDGYRNSETHHQRQYYGPSSLSDPSFGDAMAVDPPHNSSHPRYPGTGNLGYNGVTSSGGGSGGGGGGYANPRYDQPGGFPQNPQFPSAQAAQYNQGQQSTEMFTGMAPGAPSMVPQGFGQRPTAQESGYVQGAQFRQQDPIPTTSLASRGIYQTSGPGYSPANEYSSYQQPGAPGAPGYAAAQPLDSFYGRGPQQPAGYSNVPDQPQQQQYGETQVPSRTPVSSPSAQAQILSSSGPSTSRRERDPDRHRERERDRDRERDRESDRHAAERHAHRHRTRP